MPLSEKLRLDAGRHFAHTLIARFIVALLLILTCMIVTVKNTKQHSEFNIMGDQTKSQVTVVAQNDTYGR